MLLTPERLITTQTSTVNSEAR